MVNPKKKDRKGKKSMVIPERKICTRSSSSSSSAITTEKGSGADLFDIKAAAIDEKIRKRNAIKFAAAQRGFGNARRGETLIARMPEFSRREIERLRRISDVHAEVAPKTFEIPILDDDQHLDRTQYHLKRLNTIADRMYAPGGICYSRKFSFTPLTMPIPEVVAYYKSIKTEPYLSPELSFFLTRKRTYRAPIEHNDVRSRPYLAGRLMSKVYSSDVITYDLVGFGGQIQLKAFPWVARGSKDLFLDLHSRLRVGDYVAVDGFTETIAGELCFVPCVVINLSHCLHKMPPMLPVMEELDASISEGGGYPGAYILKDQGTSYCPPSQDPTSSEVKFIYDTRTKVVSYIRHFLDNLGFLKVDSPILTMVPGGSDVHPFVSPYNDLDMKMFMEIAPELYLKHFVGGGKERVYVIGQQFRNNGIHLIRCPEFMCEFYMVLADYHYLMKLTEQILSGMVKELTGGYKVAYHANGCDNNPIEIDFTPPFRRISMIDELEKMANLSIPKDLASEEARQCLADACTKFDINCSPPQTTSRLLEKLAMHFLEDTCVNPTFIMEHPKIMSPRAKAANSLLDKSKSGLAERFQLFINKFELINSYTEENNPVEHRYQFANHVKDQKSGDEETVLCVALDYGLPTTGAWVLGIDRLTMLLTDSQNIKTGSCRT